MHEEKNQEIIRGFIENDNAVLTRVYQDYYPFVERMILNAHGDKDDAREIFHQSLIIIYQRIQKAPLVLRCAFSTYLYAISRNLWYKELKERSRFVKIGQGNEPAESYISLDAEQIRRRDKILEFHLSQLSKDCRKILEMHFSGKTLADICRVLGYRDVHYASDRKYRCRKSLINRIRKDPEYHALKDEIR